MQQGLMASLVLHEHGIWLKSMYVAPPTLLRTYGYQDRVRRSNVVSEQENTPRGATSVAYPAALRPQARLTL